MHAKLILKHTAKWRILYVVALLASLSFFGVKAFDTYQPTVMSDKDDYAPGEVAIITGYGWTQDSLVDVHLEEDPAHDHHHGYHDTKVNPDGSWQIEYPIEDRHLGVAFTVIVVGKQSGVEARTYFTDNGPYSATISPNTGYVSASSQTYSITFKNEATNGNPQLGSFRIKLPDGFGTPTDISISAPGNWLLASTQGYVNGYNATTGHIGITADKNPDRLARPNSLTLTFKSHNPNIPGSYEFTTEATGNTGMDFSSSLGSLATGASQPIVHINKLTTSLVVNSASSKFAGTTSLSATLRSNSQPVANKSISFYLDGNLVGSANTGSDGVATLNNVQVNGINVGVYANKIAASFAEDGSYLSSSGSAELTITKADATISLTQLEHTYNGSLKAATATTDPAGLTGVTVSYKAEGADESAYTTDAPVNAGVYDVRAVLNNANYEATPVSGTLNIGKADATVLVTVGGPYTYDNTAKSVASAIVTGIAGADLGAATVVYKQGNATVAAPTNAGEYEVHASFAGNTNYNPASDNSKVMTIGKATPTITLTVGGPYTYDGDPKTVSSANVLGVGGVNLGAATVTYKLGENTVASPVNAGTYDVIASYAGNQNYEPAEANGELVIEKAVATFVVSNLYDKVYNGDAHSVTVATIPSGLSGVVIKYYDLDLNEITNTSNLRNAGSYLFKASLNNDNYYIDMDGEEVISGLFSVAKKELTVTADNKTKTYGDANPALTVNYSGFVNGQDATALTTAPTAITTANQHSAVGTYPITVSGGASVNYSFKYVAGTLTIDKRNASVTPVAANKTYGDDDPTFTGSLTGFLSGDNVTASYTRTAGENVADGPYTISATLSPAAVLGNYNITYNTAQFTINKANATIAVNGYNAVYDGNAHGASGTATGVKGEALSGLNLGNTFTNVPGGTAYWTFTDVTGNYNNANGSVAIEIGKANATLVVNGFTGTYDGEDHGATGSATGVGGALLEGLSLGARFTNAPGGTANWSFDGGINYNNQSGSVAIAISKADATINVSDYYGTYNGQAHGASGTAKGVKNEDLSSLISLGNSFTSVPGGTANWTFAGNTNYNSASGNAAIVINPRAITVTADPKSKVYGNNDPALTYEITSGELVQGDAIGGALNRAAGESVGKYAIGKNTLNAGGNYTITYIGADLEIEKANLTVKADDGYKSCGQPNYAFTGVVTGAKFNDTFTITYTTVADEHSGVGTYAIVPTPVGAALGNYNVNSIPGVLTVGGVTVDASSVAAPQAVKNTVTTLTIKVLNSSNTAAANVPVKLYFNNSSSAAVSTSNAAGEASFNVGTLSPGVYKVRAVAGADCAEQTVYLPVYDPNGGFVTGGGWITSPEGAIRTTDYGLAGNNVSGKASFGFVAKYKKGSQKEVEGNTEFQFNDGNLSFKSTLHSEMSLVIASDKATYRGVGTLNGYSGFKFTVIATDGDLKGKLNNDRFRIRIWDAGDVLVYDNNLAGDDYDEASDIIGGGSIVIHEVKPAGGGSNSSKLVTEAKPALEQQGSFYNYPNSFSDRTTIAFSVTADENYTLDIYDMKGALVKKVSAGLAEANRVYEFNVDGRSMAEGIYIARLATGSGSQSIKMILKK